VIIMAPKKKVEEVEEAKIENTAKKAKAPAREKKAKKEEPKAEEKPVEAEKPVEEKEAEEEKPFTTKKPRPLPRPVEKTTLDLDEETRRLLGARKANKASLPEFNRIDSHKNKSLKVSWRKPRATTARCAGSARRKAPW